MDKSTITWIQTLLPLAGIALAFYVTQTTSTAVLTERLDSLIEVMKEVKEERKLDREVLMDHEKRIGKLEGKVNKGG